MNCRRAWVWTLAIRYAWEDPINLVEFPDFRSLTPLPLAVSGA